MFDIDLRFMILHKTTSFQQKISYIIDKITQRHRLQFSAFAT